MNFITSFLILATTYLTTQTSASGQQHLSEPTLLWNSVIQSPPSNRNVVQISPDDKWLYVTSHTNGELSKLDPESGRYVGVFTPEQRRDDGQGGNIPEDQVMQWVTYGGEGISFHMDGDDSSYLVYWVFDVPPPYTGLPPSSRVFAIEHDEEEDFNVLWTKAVPGNIAGTPVIGSDGEFVYFTYNYEPPRSPPNPPTTTPATTDTNSPTAPPVAAEFTTGDTPAPTVPPREDSNLFNNSTSSNNTESGDPERRRTHAPSHADDGLGLDDRNLQTTSDETSGRFMILDGLTGDEVYEFISRDELSIQKHSFAPAGIAHSPEYGNYNGGEENDNDVIMWGSLAGGEDARQGETMLFQLPEVFYQFNDVGTNTTSWDTSQFKVQVLESVSWTTKTRPTFSADGLDVYFAINGNEFTGWNNGQKFDVVANMGPVALPSETEVEEGDVAGRPIVLANDDELLLLESTDRDTVFAGETEKGKEVWTASRSSLENTGPLSSSTAIRLSPDGEVAYLGMDKNGVQGVNVTDGSQLWVFRHPSNDPSDAPMAADFSIGSSGEHLYYSRTGRSISALRIAEKVQTDPPTSAPTTEVPTSTPSLMPIRETLSPSQVPSSASSLSPSKSTMPSLSIFPTVTRTSAPTTSILLTIPANLTLCPLEESTIPFDDSNVAVLQETIEEVAQSGLDKSTQQVTNVTILSIGNVSLFERKAVKRQLQTQSSCQLCQYELVLQELCGNISCSELAVSSTMYENVTTYMEGEIENGNFTTILQTNAIDCGNDCAELQGTTVEGGTFGNEEVAVLTSTPTSSPNMLSSLPSASNTTTPTSSPVIAEAEAGTGETPSPTTPTAIQSNDNSSSTPATGSAELSDSSTEEEEPLLSTTAIIGIAVGGGIGLLLMIGAICYISKKKRGEDDGVDTEWHQSHKTPDDNAGGAEGAAFQYSGQEGMGSNAPGQSQQTWGEGELRW